MSHSSTVVPKNNLKIYTLSALNRNSVYRTHQVSNICLKLRNYEKDNTLYFVLVKVKGKGKDLPTAGHEGPEGE